jgi:hypothetical protein
MRKVNSGLFITLDDVTESPDQWQFDAIASLVTWYNSGVELLPYVDRSAAAGSYAMWHFLLTSQQGMLNFVLGWSRLPPQISPLGIPPDCLGLRKEAAGDSSPLYLSLG